MRVAHTREERRPAELLWDLPTPGGVSSGTPIETQSGSATQGSAMAVALLGAIFPILSCRSDSWLL